MATYNPNVPAQAPFNTNPNPTSDTERPRFTRGQKILAGVAATATLVGGGIFAGYKAAEGGRSAAEHVADPGRVAAAPEVPGAAESEADFAKIDIATYPHEMFTDLPYGVQLDKAARYFDTAFENGAVDKYKRDAAAINGYTMEGGVGTGSISDTPQEIANRFTIEVNTYRHEQNLNLARNLVSGVFLPGSASYQVEVAKIGNGSEMTPTTLATFEATDVFRQGKFADVMADGSPTRVIDAAEMTTGRVFNMIVQERASSTDPSVTKPVIIDEIGSRPLNTVYQQHLSQWKPTTPR